MKTKGTLNAFQLKLIMLVLMLADHMHDYLFQRELLFAHYMARVVMPVFAFFIAEGMVHTKSRPLYMLRLLAAGAVMAAGNGIIFRLTGDSLPNNIFLPLAAGAAAVYAIDGLKHSAGSRKPVHLATVLLVLCSVPFCEGGFLVQVSVLIFYYLRRDKKLMCLVYVIVMGALHLTAYISTGVLSPQLYMVTGIIPILLYNGERGNNSAFAKVLFYIFYPAHIWIIYAVSRMI